MESNKQQQEMRYSSQGPVRHIANSNKAKIDFYRQETDKARTQQNANMGSASTQREVYSDDNEGEGLGTLSLEYKNKYALPQGVDSNNKLYQLNSNSESDDNGAMDMMMGSKQNAKSETRRQTIDIASKKILDGFIGTEKGGVVGGTKQQQHHLQQTNKQTKDQEQRQTKNNRFTGTSTKQSNNIQGGAGLARQQQQNNLEVVIVPDYQQNSYGLSMQPNNNNNEYQQQPSKLMAKSQSQNRLLFSSPDMQAKVYASAGGTQGQSKLASTGGGGNGPTQQQHQQQQQEKISFFKDQHINGGPGDPRINTQNQGQDLLFKQHLQYSTGGGAAKSGGAYQLKSNGNRFLSHNSTKECTYCNKTIGFSCGTAQNPSCSATICSENKLGMMIQNDLSKKYSTNRDYYNVKIVNDLIYNENTHVVSIFKDYLILDDINEFLKRTYNIGEVKVRLPKLCSFYDKYSQVFPNFVVLPESKYMFKNIQRKQKLIDEQYQLQEELAKKQHQSLLDDDKMFNSKFYNSVYLFGDVSMSRQQYEDQAKQISTAAVQNGKTAGHPRGGRIDQMKMDELVDRFLMKDSESNIQLTTTMGVDFSQSMIVLPPYGAGGRTSDIQPAQKQQPQSIKQKQPSYKQLETQQQTKTNMMMTPATKTAFPFKEQGTKSNKQTTSVAGTKVNPGQANSTTTKKTAQQEMVMSTTSKKPMGQSTASQLIAQSTQKRQKSSFNTNTTNQKTGGLASTNLVNTANNMIGVARLDMVSSSNKSGGGTTTSQQSNINQVLSQGGGGGTGSSKTTPRLNKHTAYTSNQDNIREQPLQLIGLQQMQQSPDTKAAVTNYLQLCQIELNQDQSNSNHNQLSSNNVQSVDSGEKQKKSSTGTTVTGTGGQRNVYESPNMKSPQQNGRHSKKSTALISSGSQNAFNNNIMQSTLSMSNNRQMMRSQAAGGPLGSGQQQQSQMQNQINNMKKTTSRLSGGGNGGMSLKPTQSVKKLAVSPVPQNIYSTAQQQSYNNQGVYSTGSRNTAEQNSTQKSGKMVNSHAKYLSGGNEHYQKMLNTGSNNATGGGGNNGSQGGTANIYTTHETISTHMGGGNSSSKKMQIGLQNQHHLQKTSLFSNQSKEQQKMMSSNNNNNGNGGGVYNMADCEEGELINELGEQLTGEDCEGVADERLCSPDAFSTDDNGRKSLDSRSQNGAGGTRQGNNIMLTSIEGEKVLSQYTNYDQIKKHLEKYIQNNHSQQPADTVTSYKKFQEQSWEKQQRAGGGAGSAGVSISNDTSNSRNAGGVALKQFESLKQRIRGAFDQNMTSTEQQQLLLQNSSGNKTPIKGSTISKKSHEMPQVNNNRISLESRDMMSLQQPDQVMSGIQSTTSANTRTLPFSQAGFVNNYRSTTNLQHRKGSNTNYVHENSVEQKRQSQKHPSFKEISKESKIFKRCATGKTLSINEIQHTFGSSQIINNLGGTGIAAGVGTLTNSNSQTLINPTFINNKLKQQKQQQAANTVRVMTPSYSLASLSKIISPTQNASPMTMTVTLAGAMQNKKQGLGSIGAKKSMGGTTTSYNNQPNSSTGMLMTNSQSHHTFMLADKTSKLISAQKGSTSNLSKAAQLSTNKSLKQSSNMHMNNSIKQPVLQQSNSLSNLQINTPRANQEPQLRQPGIGAYLYQQQQQQQHQEQSYQNMSCTAVSTENNSAVKTLESKHPKFMRTIEEYGVGGNSQQQQQTYNNILSASMGGLRKSGHGLSGSQSQAQLDLKQKQKMTSVGNTIQQQAKKQMIASSSVSHFKTPSQQILAKKNMQNSKQLQQQF